MLKAISSPGLTLLSSSSFLAQSRGNRNIAILGDSRTFQCTVNTPGTEISRLAQGYIDWVLFQTGQRCNFNVADNYGVSGDTTTLMLARVPGMIANSTAKLAIILIGTNDASSSVPYATTVANINATNSLLLNAGWTIIYFAELPRGDSTNTSSRLTATQLAVFMRYVEYLRNLRSTRGIFVADAWSTWAAPLSTTGDVVSATYTKDGLHPNPLGAYWMAQPLITQINALYPPVWELPQTNSDVFDATNNLTGCLNSNPMMGGTGGTFNATGGSGTIADGWSENAGPTWTRTYSKQTLANGQAAQQVVIGGTGTASGVSLRQVVTAGNLTVGDTVYATASVEFDPSMSNISQIALQLLDNNAITYGDFRRALTTEVVPNVSTLISGVMRTPPCVLTTTTLQIQLQMTVLNGVSVSGTIRMGQVAVRKVV